MTVPCMPIPAPSRLNSELSATSAADDDDTTASPKPKPDDSTNSTANEPTWGMLMKVAAQMSNPITINGCRPTRSDTRHETE